VVRRTDVVPELEPLPGKGEVLWRALAATTGDVLCYLDSDLVDFDPAFVPALLGPLLVEDGVHLVKGFYRRPLRLEAVEGATGGGRVTELLVRPLLAALRPELAGVVQPLGGEYAGTRELLESLRFAAGYGVEIGLLLDTHAERGLDASAQVNLGVRKHRNRSLLQLGVMARQILAAALHHCGVPDAGADLTQFVQVGGEWLPFESATMNPTKRRANVMKCSAGQRLAGPNSAPGQRIATGRCVLRPSTRIASAAFAASGTSTGAAEVGTSSPGCAASATNRSTRRGSALLSSRRASVSRIRRASLA